jgi:hypothetical protein
VKIFVNGRTSVVDDDHTRLPTTLAVVNCFDKVNVVIQEDHGSVSLKGYTSATGLYV